MPAQGVLLSSEKGEGTDKHYVSKLEIYAAKWKMSDAKLNTKYRTAKPWTRKCQQLLEERLDDLYMTS